MKRTYRIAVLRAALCLAGICVVGLSANPRTHDERALATPKAPPQTSAAQSTETGTAAPYTLELYSVKARFENDGTGKRQFDVRVKANTAEGAKQLKTLSFDYNALNEKFTLVFLHVSKPDGNTVEAKSDAVADGLAPAAKDAQSFSELREANVTVPPMSAGDTLTYEAAISIVRPAAPGQFWFSYDFLSTRPANDEELEINLPTDRAIHIHNAPQFPPKIAASGDRKIYSWKRLHATPSSSESEQSSANKTPDIALTSFREWQDFGKWFAAMEQASAKSSVELSDKAKDLAAAQKTDDKIEAIYEFVAKQIRLVHIPPEQTKFQIHDVGKVLSAGYGDDFDKCALLATMLSAAGFHADVAVVPATAGLGAEFPWPGAIARALVVAEAGKTTLWMDPYADAIPFRLILPNLRGKQALVASSSPAPHFSETPLDPPFASMQTVEITGTVTPLGKLTATIRYVLRGDNEYALRMAFESTPKEQWKGVTQTMATLDGFRGTVLDTKPDDPADTHDPFTLEFVLVTPDFLDWSQAKFAVPLPLPTFGLPDPPPEVSQPIQLGSPLQVTAKVTLTFPVNDFPQAPVGAAVKRDYAEYHSEYSAQEHSITAERSLCFLTRELPASRRADYQAFASAVQADESQPLKMGNIIPGVPSDAPPSQLMEAGTAELQSKQFAKALQLFEQVQEVNPQQPNLWLEIGTAQLELGKYEEAVAALRKHTQANPKDPAANNLLGVALYDEKKYDEAIAAFKAQLAIKPLDQNAYGYLGAVYIDEKKFGDARAELEKAAVLDPQSAIVRLRLGESELGLGKTDAALSDFQEASTLSPSPVVANEIAYTLAEHKTALDRAKTYADAAINSTESSLSRIDLRQLSANNIAAMSALPAFWDTLGWVYFEQQKFAEAEPLIEAAWRLNQISDTGDHLGQIYEARGETTLAIRAFEQAIAAGSATPETRARLAKLLGSGTEIDARVKRAATELVRERTIPLGSSHASGKAEFLVLVEAGPAGPRAREAKFLFGDDKLIDTGERFRNAQFPSILPRGSKARIVLRGAVTCSAKTAKCEFAFDRPRGLLTR